MKALITGAAGFVGPWLKKELGEAICLDKNSGDHQADILDRKALMEIFEKEQPDQVFHLAAQSSVAKSWHEPEETMKVNVKGTMNVLDAVRKHCPQARVLVVSSAEVYGKPERLPLKEDDPLKPVSPYGKSRVAQEELVGQYTKLGVNAVVIRSFSHTGPGQSPSFVCSEFAKAVAEGEKSITIGDGSIKRDFSDVRDVVRGYRLALERFKPGTYNLCSGKAYSIKEILDKLISISGAEIKVESDESKIRKNDIPELLGNNSKFSEAFGWKPEIPFEKTLSDLLEYWQAKT
ncbi:MAG: GDP-mannose 4,6-dehydratase [Nanoarchaeota archaeon]|nr:GDP-mannose 4,6-dehydratase [Nanoarchaeota archaeon]